MAATPSYATANASQCIVPGYNPSGAPGFVPYLCSVLLATYIEQRVQTLFLSGAAAPGSDLSMLRAQELQATALPGNI